jgi:hypothetical protein
VGKVNVSGDLQEINSANMSIASIYPPSNDYCEVLGYRINNFPNFNLVNNIEMRKVSGDSYWDGDMRSGRDLKFAIFPTCNETFVLEVRAQNDCGWSEWVEYSIYLDVCPANCSDASNNGFSSANFCVSPVPANDFMQIDKLTSSNWSFVSQCNNQILDSQGNPLCIYFAYIQIFDNNGTSVLSVTHQLGASLDISHLPAGNYIMHISSFNQTEVLHLPIQ